MLRERAVHGVDVRLVEARADDRRPEIVVPYHEGDAAQIVEGTFMQAQERLEVSIDTRR